MTGGRVRPGRCFRLSTTGTIYPVHRRFFTASWVDLICVTQALWDGVTCQRLSGASCIPHWPLCWRLDVHPNQPVTPIPAGLVHRPGVSSLANIQVLTPLLSCSGPRCWQQSQGCCSAADAGYPPAVRPCYRRFRHAEEAEMSWAQLNTNHLLLTPGPKAETTKSNLEKTGHLFPFRNIGDLLLNTPDPILQHHAHNPEEVPDGAPRQSKHF